MNCDSISKQDTIHKDPVGISTAVCTHIPLAPFSHVGQVTTCKLCGCVLLYGNNPAGTKHRMSKKERRKNKELLKMQTLAQSIKDLQKGSTDVK